MSTKAIVLAAGKGTRMKSELAKVLHEIAGRPLITWACELLVEVGVDEIVAVVGHQAEDVQKTLPPGVAAPLQPEQLGTAHATSVGLAEIGAGSDDVVLVLPGDMPLLQPSTIRRMLERHGQTRSGATILSAVVPDPTGYGRIIRDDDGEVVAIVEEGDATAQQRNISEINTSVYAFSGELLANVLERVGTDNVQGERYLTDVIGLLAHDGHRLEAVTASAQEAMGVNSHQQLAEAAAIVRRRINGQWMAAGVWMLDPERVYVDADVELEPGCRIWPGTYLLGDTRVAAGAEIGPDVMAEQTTIGSNAKVWYAVLRSCDVGAGVSVGPYASLRPGTVLDEGSKVGTFVEIKGSTVGPRSKVPHLSYIGDATIGEDSNVGAGSITCNWDGERKHPTVIGDRVFIGSDTMLVAPLEIGDDAHTGAGSTITRDVPPGSLAVERSHQKEVPDYAARRRRRARRERD